MLADERLWVLFKRHWRQTMTYWSVFFSFGLCIAFLGPTILDLRCQTHSTLQQITWVFFSQQLCLLIGSSMGGIFKKTMLSSLSSLFTCTLLISAVFTVIPLCPNVALLSVAMAIAGKAMGVIDTIANLQLVRLYQMDSAVYLQALHFFIGLGALVSPLVAEPFLAEDNCIQGNVTAGNASFPSSRALQHLRSTLSHKGLPLPHNASLYPLLTDGPATTRISYAFWIMALINLPVPVVVLALMYHERLLSCFKPSPRLLDKGAPPPSEGSDQGHSRMFSCPNPHNLCGRPASFFFIHILGGAVLFITDGIIGSYAGFVYTYAVSPPLLMGHKTAGCLDSVFWASITAGRLASIYLAYRYTGRTLLSCSLLGVIMVQSLLLVFSSSRGFLFLGTCVLGLLISSVFPCTLAFTEDMLDYSGCATTVLVTSASAGEMMLQLLVGTLIHSHGSRSFLLCGMAASCFGLSFFLLLLYAQRSYRRQQDLSKGVVMTEKSGGNSWSKH